MELDLVLVKDLVSQLVKQLVEELVNALVGPLDLALVNYFVVVELVLWLVA
jgi:hypothetical protein